MRKLLFVSLFLITINAFAVKPEQKFNEKYRPQFHFTAPQNWINNPCGLVKTGDLYHLYFQHNPSGNNCSNIHWGHAVSKDLVHWELMPVVLSPAKEGEDKNGNPWPGTVMKDINKQFSDGNALLALYTRYGEGQFLAISNDDGKTWREFEGNPVMPVVKKEDRHDPRVFWHAQTSKWVMVIYREPNGNDAEKGFSIYNSDDLKEWAFKSHIPGFYESPDLFELPVNNRQNDTRWVLLGADGSYKIGDFDGEKFTPETPFIQSDYGKNYYAGSTWKFVEDDERRVIQIAWMRSAEYPEMPFSGQLTFPVELSLERFTEGIRLVKKPVKQIELLHNKGFDWEDKQIYPGVNQNIVKKVDGDCLHIKGVFDLKTCDNFGFLLRKGKKETGLELYYSVKKGVLFVMGQNAPLKARDGKISLEILVDRTSVEVFANDGQCVLSSCYTSDPENDKIQLFTIGGEIVVDNLEVYTLKSMYEPEDEK